MPKNVFTTIAIGNRTILAKTGMSLIESDSEVICLPHFVQNSLCCSVEEQFGQIRDSELIISSFLLTKYVT